MRRLSHDAILFKTYFVFISFATKKNLDIHNTRRRRIKLHTNTKSFHIQCQALSRLQHNSTMNSTAPTITDKNGPFGSDPSIFG